MIDYVKSLRKDSPRDVVTVFIPEYVVGKWFENLLHNQSALRLKGRLLYEPGVMVTSVPWQLNSSIGKDLNRYDRELALAPLRGPRGQRPSGSSGTSPAAPGTSPGGPPAASGSSATGSSEGGASSPGLTSDSTPEPDRTPRP